MIPDFGNRNETKRSSPLCRLRMCSSWGGDEEVENTKRDPELVAAQRVTQQRG